MSGRRQFAKDPMEDDYSYTPTTNAIAKQPHHSERERDRLPSRARGSARLSDASDSSEHHQTQQRVDSGEHTTSHDVRDRMEKQRLENDNDIDREQEKCFSTWKRVVQRMIQQWKMMWNNSDWLTRTVMIMLAVPVCLLVFFLCIPVATIHLLTEVLKIVLPKNVVNTFTDLVNIITTFPRMIGYAFVTMLVVFAGIALAYIMTYRT